MSYILAVFSVRTETMSFYNMLKRARINAMIVETPKIIQASCGISVKFIQADFLKVKNLMALNYLKNSVRYYVLNGTFGRTNITPLNY